MRSCSFLLFSVFAAAFTTQVLGIQVECRQCHILRQNEEYFEQAKKELNKRSERAAIVKELSAASASVPSELSFDDHRSEPPLVETAKNTAFVPRQDPDVNFGFAPQVGLQETVFAYRTSYQ